MVGQVGLPQTEIRKRIRAAMGLAGIKSWEALAEKTGMSRSTLKDLGTTRANAEKKHLVPIAAVCELPYEWFTIPSFSEAVSREAARLHEEDPATRFGAAAKREAEKQDEHPESEREDPPDEGAGGPGP